MKSPPNLNYIPLGWQYCSMQSFQLYFFQPASVDPLHITPNHQTSRRRTWAFPMRLVSYLFLRLAVLEIFTIILFRTIWLRVEACLSLPDDSLCFQLLHVPSSLYPRWETCPTCRKRTLSQFLSSLRSTHIQFVMAVGIAHDSHKLQLQTHGSVYLEHWYQTSQTS